MFPSHSRPVTAPDPSCEPSRERLGSRGTADHHAAPIRRLGCVAFLHLCAACGEAPTATEDPGREPAPPPPVTPPAPPPPNLAPSRVDTIPPLSVAIGATETIAVAGYFSDPEGEPLAYSAETMNSRVATVAAGRADTLSVTGIAIGEALVWVRATDPVGGSASQPLNVTVRAPNRAPETNGTIPPQTIDVGDTLAVLIARFFRDPDGDTLNYSASSSADSVATAALSGDTLTLTGVSSGTAAVTITARDQDGETARLAVPVRVRRPTLPAPFDIRVVLRDSTRFSPRMMAAIDSAVVRWERPLAKTVLPAPPWPSVICGLVAEQERPLWDAEADIVVVVYVKDDDKYWANAETCGTVTWNDMVQGGNVAFSEPMMAYYDTIPPADASAWRDFEDTAAHEIGHLLGFGRSTPFLALVRDPMVEGDTAEAKDTHFVGEQAIAAFNAEGGDGYEGAKVPLWNFAVGDNPANGIHWRSTDWYAPTRDIFALDIMGSSPDGVARRISAITLATLADLGYTVDLALAEPRP